jgi:3'-phosphoadenosine 5'-phosphosulfate sulfotransferase (PAPS reductase)/FAD synthetase
MSAQFFPRDPDKIVVDAIVEHDPSHVFALLSGGNDSTVLTSWARRSFGHKIDAAVFIDTGTSIEPDPEDPSDTTPSVREFVEAFCANRYLPLIVLEAGDAYERMVRQHGVPGPGAHRYPYVNLKERQIDRLIREHKTRWNDRILLLTGARAAESQRRMGHAAASERDGCTVWVNPLIDWTDEQMRDYRAEHGLEESPVAALLHRSGECNCGAFAKPGEREMLQSLFPRWFERVVLGAEATARECGKWARWGERPAPFVYPFEDLDEVGPLCRDCALPPDAAA